MKPATFSTILILSSLAWESLSEEDKRHMQMQSVESNALNQFVQQHTSMPISCDENIRQSIADQTQQSIKTWDQLSPAPTVLIVVVRRLKEGLPFIISGVYRRR